MTDKGQWLQAKIGCVNAAHTEAKRIVRSLRSFFSQFIGQKVVKKTNGNLLESIKKNMPTLTDTPTLLVTLSSDTAITVTIRSTFYYGENFVSHQTIFYIAQVSKDGIITEVSDSPINLRDDYNLQEMAGLRERYRLLKAEEEKLKRELYVFADNL